MVVPMVSLFELSHAVELLDGAASPAMVDQGLRAAGLSRKMLRGEPGFLPYTVEAILIEHVARALGDPLLGVRLGGSYDYGAYDAYARYVLGAETLRAALERGARAFPLIHPGCEVVLRTRGEHLLVGRTSGLGGVVGVQHLDDGALPIIGQLLGHFLGPGWQPDWVEAVADGRRRADDIADLLGVPVRHGAAIPAVAVRLRDLDTPNPHPPKANEVVGFLDLPWLMGHAPPETVAETVRSILGVQFGTGDLSEESMARRLGMGRRTLQRALQSEGTSFRQVKAQVIEARARTLLADTQLDVEAIARALGYDEPNSFRRAFRGWTGLTPNTFRTALGHGAPHGREASTTSGPGRPSKDQGSP